MPDPLVVARLSLPEISGATVYKTKMWAKEVTYVDFSQYGGFALGGNFLPFMTNVKSGILTATSCNPIVVGVSAQDGKNRLVDSVSFVCAPGSETNEETVVYEGKFKAVLTVSSFDKAFGVKMAGTSVLQPTTEQYNGLAADHEFNHSSLRSPFYWAAAMLVSAGLVGTDIPIASKGAPSVAPLELHGASSALVNGKKITLPEGFKFVKPLANDIWLIGVTGSGQNDLDLISVLANDIKSCDISLVYILLDQARRFEELAATCTILAEAIGGRNES